MAAKLMMRLEPPAETNGSGMPVTGMSPTTTAMLTNACRQIQAVIPAASIAPKVSGAPREVRIPRNPIARNRTMTSPAPTRPNSSPMMAKMKSLNALGRNSPPASRLSPRPAPKTPPSARAKKPWMLWKPRSDEEFQGSSQAVMRSIW